MIGELMIERFLGGKAGPCESEIRKIMRDEFEINISYWKAWRYREKAMEKEIGSTKGSYAILPLYLARLAKGNPGSTIELKLDDCENAAPTFKYLFLAFGASVEGCKYMRRVIVIDRIYLHGRYGGCMLTASDQEENLQIFLLAYGIVDSEKDKSWEWFFRCLHGIIPDESSLVFVLDRHSSIYSGLRKVYPLARHGACVIHLARNVAVKFKGKRLPSLMAFAARKYQVGEFYKVFSELEAIDKTCANCLRCLGYAHWTRSHSIGMQYKVMTTNIAESLNNVLKEGREFPIISMIESLRTSLMRWFSRRRDAATKEKCTVTPKRKTCSCREFEMLQIPCSHVLARAYLIDMPTDKLVGDVYLTSVWHATYGGGIYPVPTTAEESKTYEKLNPPATRQPRCRPKKIQILSKGEFKRRSKKKGRLCTRCLCRGHNKATCKIPLRDPGLGL